MIYIISGASRSGKTITAQILAQETGLSLFSIDFLMMGLMKGLPSLGVHDKMWAHEIAEKIWPILENMIKSMIYGQEDYIFEGEAFIPLYVSQLLQEHPGEVKAVFLGYSTIDINRKIQDVKNNPNPKNDWLLQMPEQEIRDHLVNMKDLSQKIKDQCSCNNVPYFDTSQDFEKKIKRVIEFLK